MRGAPRQRVGHHHSARSLRENVLSTLVLIGASWTPPTPVRINQSRIVLAQVVEAESQPAHHLRPKVVHQDICPLSQSTHNVAALRMFQVNRQTALVAIQREEYRILAVCWED